MTTATQGAITRAEFSTSREFLALTDKQRVWVDLFIESQDMSRATRTAYGTVNGAYEAMLTRKIETSPRVIAALNLFYGRSPKEAFLSELERTIQRETGPAKVAAMQLMARLKFSGKSENPEFAKNPQPTSDAGPTKQQFKVGDIATLNERQYRITVLNPDGSVAEADKLP
jgi:hypothetical protein